jgi:uncharacterized membrane protein YgcG
MQPNWTLRQLLALVRGVALMVALFWALILVQLVPALLRGGLSGVRGHIERVATAGMPPERWSIAVIRMYEALGATFLLGCALFLGQRYLGRKLKGVSRASGQEMTYSSSSPS